MKWNKAIEQIEKAIADGKVVEVSFHRKWARNCNEFKTDKVDAVGTYDWKGETLKFVDTWEGYGLEEGNFIIDEVIVVGDQKEPAPAEVNSDEIESKEEDRPRIRVSYWSDDTLTEVVQKTVVGHITFCDNKATFEEAGRLVVIPCRLLIRIQALDR